MVMTHKYLKVDLLDKMFMCLSMRDNAATMLQLADDDVIIQAVLQDSMPCSQRQQSRSITSTLLDMCKTAMYTNALKVLIPL